MLTLDSLTNLALVACAIIVPIVVKLIYNRVNNNP